MPTKEEIMAQIQIFKNAKGTLVQDSLVKILEMLCENIATEETTPDSNEEVVPDPGEEVPGTP